jgi:hypothetical protein
MTPRLSIRLARAAAAVAATAPSAALAADLAVGEGVFCNGANELDAILTAMELGLDPRHAVELANSDAIRCTYIDSIQYMLDHVEALEEAAATPRYRGELVGVIVGGRLRPVSPGAELFFVTPGGLTDASLQRRL